MYSSQKGIDILFEIYKDSRTVFRINDIALLVNSNDRLLYQKLNKLVKKGKLLNIRKGIYVKEGYNSEELACLLYTPTYISLGYVLQRSGIIFQYDSSITNISYLNREILVNGQPIQYRQIKREILLNTSGIININNTNIATPERAFLDTLYLNGFFYFDNIKNLNIKNIYKFLPIYNSTSLIREAEKILNING
jgi:predicted transcriptional regulator of viral defense system